MSSSAPADETMHILVLTDREWLASSDPKDGPGIRAEVEHWSAQGHRVTVVASRHRGSPRNESHGPNLEIHRRGRWLSLRVRAVFSYFFGSGRDADVVLEVVDGAAFYTPIWLLKPRVTLVREVNSDRRSLRSKLKFDLPLRLFYHASPLIVRDSATRDELEKLGLKPETIAVLEASDGVTGDHPDPAAEKALEVMRQSVATGRVPLRGTLGDADSLKAIGLAAATIISNGLALIFTLVFSRVLGNTGYGALAALLSGFLILAVAGFALQVACARDIAHGLLGSGGRLAATLAGWLRFLGYILVVTTIFSILFRHQIAGLVGVSQEWAAAALLPSGVLWLGLSIQRGVLQGIHAYKAVAISIVVEALGRLVLGVALVGIGLGVTGAFLGSPASFLVTSAALGWLLHRRLGSADGHTSERSLFGLIKAGWAPVLGLTLISILQNIDVIVAQHRMSPGDAGAYAAAAVASKTIIWVAIGVGLYLLPEAARRTSTGQESRGVLEKGLIIVTALAIPMLIAFAVIGEQLLDLAFGPGFIEAAPALVYMGAAMTCLALAYLCVQYMLALVRTKFLMVLGFFSVLLPVVLVVGGGHHPESFAIALLIVQALNGLAMLFYGMRREAQTAAAASFKEI